MTETMTFQPRVWRSGDPEPAHWTRLSFGLHVWIRHSEARWIIEDGLGSGSLGIDWERLLDGVDELIEADPMPQHTPPHIAIIGERIHVVHNGLIADLDLHAAGQLADRLTWSVHRGDELRRQRQRAEAGVSA